MTVRFDPDSPERFREVVAASFGLFFDDAKLGFLGEVLRRRAESPGTPVEVYLEQLETGAAEEEAGPLAEELTVGETYFFRNADQSRAFSEVVLPERMRAPNKPLSLLSAGWSSGEEPYTLAMLTRATAQRPPWQVSIRVVDLNPAALRKAASGRCARRGPAAMVHAALRARWCRAVISSSATPRRCADFRRTSISSTLTAPSITSASARATKHRPDIMSMSARCRHSRSCRRRLLGGRGGIPPEGFPSFNRQAVPPRSASHGTATAIAAGRSAAMKSQLSH